MRDAIDGLDGQNRCVWALYKEWVTRLAADMHAGGAVLTMLTRDMTADEFAETWRRLVVLYNALQPAPKTTEET